jgi:hypothetical protein
MPQRRLRRFPPKKPLFLLNLLIPLVNVFGAQLRFFYSACLVRTANRSIQIAGQLLAADMAQGGMPQGNVISRCIRFASSANAQCGSLRLSWATSNRRTRKTGGTAYPGRVLLDGPQTGSSDRNCCLVVGAHTTGAYDMAVHRSGGQPSSHSLGQNFARSRLLCHCLHRCNRFPRSLPMGDSSICRDVFGCRNGRSDVDIRCLCPLQIADNCRQSHAGTLGNLKYQQITN